MFERFQEHLQKSGLIPGVARVLVGYSGGADSTALLHLLHKAGVDVVAAHLHHGQRAEAEEELARCQAFAEQLNIPFVAGRADVPRMSRELGKSLEEAGRNARYEFFKQAAFSAECNLIATAHTRTDQVETVLLNIARGTGLRGLTGIPERRDDIIRPLLPFSREETCSYCEEHGFWTHADPANSDLTFSRARIRSMIVPELKLINPGLDASVLRLAAIADEEDRFMNGMAAAALEQAEIPLNGSLRFLSDDCEMRFSRSHLAHLPEALRKRSIRLACEALDAALSYEQTQIASTEVVGKTSGAITAEGGQVVVQWGGDTVDVRRLLDVSPFRYPITIPGETISEEFGWQFTAFETDGCASDLRRASLEATLDSAQIKEPLHFRSVKPGDSMQPFGFTGRRKLSDLMSEAKLSQAARARFPIVCDMIGPLWAPGVCVEERARPKTESTQVIVLRFSSLKV